MSFLNFLIIREEGVLQFVIGFFVFTYSCSVQKATKESNRDLPQPVAAPEECCSNSATLSRSLIISSSKAASLSSRCACDDVPGGGPFGGTRPGCACDDVPGWRGCLRRSTTWMCLRCDVPGGGAFGDDVQRQASLAGGKLMHSWQK